MRGNWGFLKWPECFFIGFILISLVSWYFNPVELSGVPVGVIPVIAFVLYYLLTNWFRNQVNWSWQEVQQSYLIFWLSGFYVAGVVILQRLNWPSIKESLFGLILEFYHQPYHLWQSESTRSVGTTGNSNATAAMLICLALLSIYASSVLKLRWQKFAALSSFVLFLYALASTGSRGACMGLIGGLIVQLWMTGRRKWTVAITLILILGILIQPELIPRNDTFTSTAEVRFKVWQASFEIFKENWLIGTLPLHFGQIYLEKTGVFLYHAHNVFLGIAAEFGIIGLGLFLAILVSTVLRARRWRKLAQSKEEKRLAGVLLSQVMALLGHGLYDYPIISPQIGLIFFLAIIIIHIQYERRCM